MPTVVQPADFFWGKNDKKAAPGPWVLTTGRGRKDFVDDAVSGGWQRLTPRAAVGVVGGGRWGGTRPPPPPFWGGRCIAWAGFAKERSKARRGPNKLRALDSSRASQRVFFRITKGSNRGKKTNGGGEHKKKNKPTKTRVGVLDFLNTNRGFIQPGSPGGQVFYFFLF